MASRTLQKKPLVEAIFEMHWEIPTGFPGLAGTTLPANFPQFSQDPFFHELFAKFLVAMQKEYPHYEPVESGGMIENIAHQVIHRFRAAPKGWPVAQLGPGIMAVNNTAGYDWSEFMPRCLDAISILGKSHPQGDQIKLKRIVLRYVDAIVSNVSELGLMKFLSTKMKIACSLPSSVFEKTKLVPSPTSYQWRSSYRSEAPEGSVNVLIALGTRNDVPKPNDAVILTTEFITDVKALTLKELDSRKWLDGSHKILGDLFFELIDGDLKKEFQ